jgi:hypothetical protein
LDSKQEVKKKERIPWLPLIIITALASVLGSAIYMFIMPSGSTLQCTYNWGVCSRATSLAVLPFILLILAYPFRKLLKINATSLTYLYTVGTIISYSNFTGTEAGYLYPVGMSRTQLFTTIAIRNAFGSWWWVPPYNVMNAVMGGGVAADWASWAGSIFFWMTFNFALFLFTSGISLVFRQRWIDVEHIPFPMTMTAHEVVRVVDVNRSNEWSLRPFMIGLVLGFVFNVPIFLQALFPWFPDIYGWRAGGGFTTCPGGTLMMDSSVIVAQNIVGLTVVSKDPVAFGLFFLAPLSVSFNVWFWTVVILVLEQVAYAFGYYTGIFSQGCGDRLFGCSGGASLMQGPPFFWSYLSAIGGSTAIVAMIIFNSRHYLRDTLRQTFSSQSFISETEKKEAVSYRTAYLILAAGTVMIIIWQMSAGIDLLSALSVLIFTISIGGVSAFYTYAHTGFLAINNLRGIFSFFPVQVRFANQIPAGTSLTEPNLIMSDFLTQALTNGGILMNFPTAQMMPLKMANLTGTSYRNTYLVAIVTVLIATPLILITKVWIVSMYGAKVFTKAACAIDMACSIGQDGGVKDIIPIAEYGAIGFVITFAIAMLHSRFIWFPFEPLGFVIATGMPGTWYGVWSAFLGAWILKTLVLRIGGSKLYERSVPLVGGFLGGVFICIFVGSILLALRFFVPF